MKGKGASSREVVRRRSAAERFPKVSLNNEHILSSTGGRRNFRSKGRPGLAPGENRYASLEKTFPDESKKLREKIEKEYAERYDILKAMAGSVPDEGKEKTEEKEE